MDFLDRHIFLNKKMQSYIDKRNKYLEKVKEKEFKDCQSDIKKLTKACKQLYNERNKQKKTSLEKYKKNGKDLFRVKIKKGKWENGKKEEDFYDKASLSVFIKSKYKTLKRLNTGERNACMMVLLMNQGVFGPLIIDQPEQYLDGSSLTGMLIPKMRELKTQQQIICVTRDEHILLSGDAEQVIATQSENEIKVVTGDINNKDIQEQIIEIFEGGKLSLIKKNRKLGNIIE